MNTFKVAEPKEHLECNSGSYSTTTTISINKNDLIPDIREHIPLPDPARYIYIPFLPVTFTKVAFAAIPNKIRQNALKTSHNIRFPGLCHRK